MASFQPFRGIRFNAGLVDLADVLSPPYDVIDDRQRAELAARSPYNAVHVDLPVDQGDRDRYDVARSLLRDWQANGILLTDERPGFTVYLMSYDDAGRQRHTTGVIGALELSPPGDDILPHEHTTPKAKSDRLDMLRACRTNLSPIWGLSLAKGLTDLLPVDDEDAVVKVTDDTGVHHAAWIVDDPATCAAISDAVAAQPVVIADGHHRYETSLTYRDERVEAEGIAGPAAATMAYVVELDEDELAIRAIHRLLSGLPPGFDLIDALSPWFERVGPPPLDQPVITAMERAGAVCAVLPDGDMLLRHRPEALVDARDLDSARLDVALAALPGHELTYQHEPETVRAAVANGTAQAGVLVRPAGIAQIAATAHGGERMPPKTTFFHPKPKTGVVFRGLD